jgi:PEP-CTERM motif-containing protein
MKRTLVLMAVVLGFATAASAATLTVTTDKTTYAVGETISLTVTGDSQNANTTTYSLIGRLTYSDTLTDPGSIGANALNPGPGWSETPPSQADGFSELFAFADFGFTNDTPNYDGGPKVLNTATLIAQAVGVVTLSWTDSLSYYNVSGAQLAGSFTIIPEPTTAALLGLGLVGLVVSGRRRS